jgi:hypothetical protein
VFFVGHLLLIVTYFVVSTTPPLPPPFAFVTSVLSPHRNLLFTPLVYRSDKMTPIPSLPPPNKVGSPLPKP